MKAVLSDLKSGEFATYEVPAPELQPGGILISTAFSAISAGTERVKVESVKKSLLGKAMARPDLVRQVLDYARSNGIRAAYQKVQARLDTLSPMGYSCSGVVLETGEGVTEFKPGDRVACGGGGYANHCEINFVPQNLAVHLPANVSLDAAALTTIGSIAMQGIRQANPAVGETLAVIGAGLVGVLAMQIARAAGCRVIAIDLSAERARKAAEMGAHIGLVPSDPNFTDAVRAFSRYGVDKAIITAASSSAEPVELAAAIVRDRGTIVIVGDVGMGVSRSNMYMKELSLIMSRSYGPGRYDPDYEEGGQDYPVGYVRWTERRNMEAFVDLLSSGTLNVTPLIANKYAIDSAGQAYADLKTGIYTGLFDYGSGKTILEKARRPVEIASLRPHGTVRIGCLGAGGFARGVIFPNLQALKGVQWESVATSSGIAAESARKSFRFSRAQSPLELLDDSDVDAAFILTRHDSHARYVTRALNAGKGIFVEKPLAVNAEQLGDIQSAYRHMEERGRAPFIMVGFNRRFAPLTGKVTEFFAERTEAMLVHVRINAGFIPKDSWIQRDGNGGRIVGEFCHFVDWCRAVIGCSIENIYAMTLPDSGKYNQDNITVTLNFHDGSIANLLYLANGARSVQKEYFEVFCAGKTAQLFDFRELRLSRGGKTENFRSGPDKGHAKELELTVDALKNGRPAPIPFSEIVEVTKTTFAVEEALRSRAPISLG